MVGIRCCLTPEGNLLAYCASASVVLTGKEENNRAGERVTTQLQSSDTTKKTFMKHLGKDVLTHFRNAHLFLNTCAELTCEFRNAPGSGHNNPTMEGLTRKTSRKISIF